ncbi:Uncharacterised protein (plasmid) [Mycoplasmopsis columboralis]|uniref:Uncharacterized protein n=1 Tax=Mycoplasmopsis columboralis TaxID=171282 RepID=A0A449B7Q2_9BACT|nr:Uncharacterised protein [Mycoplasmopsis columboralis]
MLQKPLKYAPLWLVIINLQKIINKLIGFPITTVSLTFKLTSNPVIKITIGVNAVAQGYVKWYFKYFLELFKATNMHKHAPKVIKKEPTNSLMIFLIKSS